MVKRIYHILTRRWLPSLPFEAVLDFKRISLRGLFLETKHLDASSLRLRQYHPPGANDVFQHVEGKELGIR